MFEAGPRHLLAHVTTLTPLLICNCPQPVRNTTLGGREERGYACGLYSPNGIPACTVEAHVCVCVCYSTRSGFRELSFRCNNLILVGQPGRWKQQNRQHKMDYRRSYL